MAAVKMGRGEAREFKNLCAFSLYVTIPSGRAFSDKIQKLPHRWFHPNFGMWEVPIIDILELLGTFEEIELQTEVPELEIIKQKRDMAKREYYNNLKCMEPWPIDMPYLIDGVFYRLWDYTLYRWYHGEWCAVDESADYIIDRMDNSTKLNPFGHQIEAYHYMMNRNVLLLADDMGLGKTIEVASACEWRHNRKPDEFSKFLYITKACLKDNVYEDLRKWLPSRNLIVVDGDKNKRMDKLRMFFKQREMCYCIIGYESVKSHIEQLNMIKIDGIAIDECHKMKDPNGATWKALSQLAWIPFKVIMSGTPVINRPEEIWTLLNFLGVEDRSVGKFIHDHYNWGGYQNKQRLDPKQEALELLHQKVSTYMLRRMKNEVMDMPEKSYQDVYVSMGVKQGELYKAVRDQILLEFKELEKTRTFGNPLVKILRLKQILTNPILLESDAPSAKHEELLDILETVISDGHKVLVFSQFEEETKQLRALLNKYNPAYVTGSVKDRKAEERKFNEDPTCKVFIGTSSSCREGLNLVRGTYAIMLDLEWAPAYIQQLEDRIYRIGQTRDVTIIRILIKNTIDDYIVNTILKRKQAIFDAVVEGKAGLSMDDVKELINNL